MKKLIFLVLFICSGVFLLAQQLPERVVVPVDLPAEYGLRVSATLGIPLETVTPFLAYSITWEGGGETVAIRFSRDGRTWEDWEVLHRDPHSIGQTAHKVSELGFTDRQLRFFQLQTVEGSFQQLKAHFYSPGDSPEARPKEAGEARNSSVCSCEQPAYQGRLDWCPAGNCPTDATPLLTSVTHLIVHHSAGTNQASDWAAVVRSIWDFHVNSNGWDDIGYNWLIDPNGVIYQGRGDNILGAHFCGTNSGTMGVCVLGNFQLIEPAEEAKNSLVQLLSWKACEEDISPLEASYHASSGKILRNISGHRDGCATLCPGDLLYPQLPGIRDQTADYIANECEAISSVDAFFNHSSVHLFPNPAESALGVRIGNELTGEILFQIHSVNGSAASALLKAEKREWEQTFYIDVENLTPGMYFLRMIHQEGSAAFRMVKE